MRRRHRLEHVPSIVKDTAQNLVGTKTRTHKPWLSHETTAILEQNQSQGPRGPDGEKSDSNQFSGRRLRRTGRPMMSRRVLPITAWVHPLKPLNRSQARKRYSLHQPSTKPTDLPVTLRTRFCNADENTSKLLSTTYLALTPPSLTRSRSMQQQTQIYQLRTITGRCYLCHPQITKWSCSRP